MDKYTRIELDSSKYGYASPPEYTELVATFGEVLVEAIQQDYQGDSLYLILRDGKYGVVTFGWGSCSGCDALQSVEDQDSLNSLQDDLYNGAVWFDTLEEVKLKWCNTEKLSITYMDKELIEEFSQKLRAL